jgi:branched-chain amino acid transport system permease protein
VPNIAQDISQAAPWAIYGLFLLLFMYLMPRGVAGALGLVGRQLLRYWQGTRPAGGPPQAEN